jgi:hypothetical protein
MAPTGRPRSDGVSTEVLEKHYDERSEEVKIEQRRGI